MPSETWIPFSSSFRQAQSKRQAQLFPECMFLQFHGKRIGRIQADLAPSTGEEVQERVKRIYATPRPVIDRVKKLLAP